MSSKYHRQEIADAIAKSLDPLLIGKEKDDILRAFGFIISSMSLDCTCTDIDECIEEVRAAAEAHFAISVKRLPQC